MEIMEVGLDEAGRGSFFGRIYAGSVVLGDIPDELKNKLRDSKKLSMKKREELYELIISNVFDYGIGYVEPWEIDQMGVGKANQLAFRKSLEKLSCDISLMRVDGIVFHGWNDTVYKCIPKGDSIYHDIMCASIIAKVEHDRYIKNLVDLEPDLEKYGLLTNMGYGTLKHRDAIRTYGCTMYHRKSFISNFI